MKAINLIIIILLLTSCERTFFEPQPANDPESNFEVFWNTFNEEYANFEERMVDWDEVYNEFRPKVKPGTTDEELWEILTVILRKLNDGHVNLVGPGRNVFTSNLIKDQKIDDELFDIDLIRSKYLKDDYRVNGYGFNTFGILEGNIGYLHIRWTSDNFPGIHEALDLFENTEGFIFDFRHNGGGDLTWAYNNLDRLTQERIFAHRSITKNGIGEHDYSDSFEWYVEPEGPYFDQPIIVLTDKYTISAAERALCAMRVLPNVTFMGENTSGGFSTKILKDLPNGWYYSVCPQKIFTADGENLEGKGFTPDIYIKNTVEEMAIGQDRTLEEAINLLN